MSGHRIVNDKNGHFYAATKFAVTALTEGTRNELAKSKSKIRITVGIHYKHLKWVRITHQAQWFRYDYFFRFISN